MDRDGINPGTYISFRSSLIIKFSISCHRSVYRANRLPSRKISGTRSTNSVTMRLRRGVYNSMRRKTTMMTMTISCLELVPTCSWRSLCRPLRYVKKLKSNIVLEQPESYNSSISMFTVRVIASLIKSLLNTFKLSRQPWEV